jgi:hypothetical protein
VQTVPEYVSYLIAAQKAAVQKIGLNVYGVSREQYVMNLATLALIGMVIKALHDEGIVLDGEWLTRLNQAYDGSWPPDLLNQIPPTP